MKKKEALKLRTILTALLGKQSIKGDIKVAITSYKCNPNEWYVDVYSENDHTAAYQNIFLLLHGIESIAQWGTLINSEVEAGTRVGENRVKSWTLV